MEEKFKLAVPKGKDLRIWKLIIDETVPGVDIRQEQERLIAEIKAGRMLSRQGAFYSEEDEHLFVVCIITENWESSLKEG